MKTKRSTKCSLRFATNIKKEQLETILKEYGVVVNKFINIFWENCPTKSELLKDIVNSVDSWFSSRLKKVAAREAIDLIFSSRARDKKTAQKPIHHAKSMRVSSTIAELYKAKTAKIYDYWLHLSSIGNKIILDIPIKAHKHYNLLSDKGKRLASYVITKKYVQFCFEIETGDKKPLKNIIGIDTGINVLASLSNGEQYGKNIKQYINKIKLCKNGSKRQKRIIQSLKQKMNEVAKTIVKKYDLIVVENLKNITKNTKRRLVKNMRRSVGHWNVRYWISTLQRKCEDNRVSFRSVGSCYTSQKCSKCGFTDRRNRKGEIFRCLNCGYEANADIQASRNILSRFLSGPYGAGCKPLLNEQRDGFSNLFINIPISFSLSGYHTG